MTGFDFSLLSQERLDDARALLAAGRYSGANYICGYAVECALKSAVCKEQRWQGILSEDQLRKLKTHSFLFLVRGTGNEARIKEDFMNEWSTVIQWQTVDRYEAHSDSDREKVEQRIRASQKLMEVLS